MARRCPTNVSFSACVCYTVHLSPTAPLFLELTTLAANYLVVSSSTSISVKFGLLVPVVSARLSGTDADTLTSNLWCRRITARPWKMESPAKERSYTASMCTVMDSVLSITKFH